MKTVAEFFNQYGGYTREEMLERAKQFAEEHVKEAITSIYQSAELRISENATNEEPTLAQSYDDGQVTITISKNSIMKAYPLKNIK